MKTIDKQIRVSAIEAETLIKEIFEKKSCESKEAKTIAQRLCLSNLKATIVMVLFEFQGMWSG